MILRLTHRTLYEYPSPARDSHNELRMMPLTDVNQRCLDFSVRTDPPVNVYSYQEVGGSVHHFTVRAPHNRLEILAQSTVETLNDNPFQNLDDQSRDWKFYAQPDIRTATLEFLEPSPYVPIHPIGGTLAGMATQESDGTIFGFLMRLNEIIFERMEYDSEATHVHSTLDEIVQLQAGVCQDFTHLMLSACRYKNIPSRYVSGYLFVGDHPEMRGYQASHAWLECLMPNGNWLGFDPTNCLLANDRYIRVHTGIDYSEVPPTRGVYMGAPVSNLEVMVRVERAIPESGMSGWVRDPELSQRRA